MHTVELSNEANKKLMFHGTTYRLYYNVFSQTTELRSTFGHSPSRTTYDWMLERIGHELYNVRRYDLLQFDGELNTYKYPLNHRFESKDEYDIENPVLQTSEHRWMFGLTTGRWHFTHLEDATLFKLTWA